MPCYAGRSISQAQVVEVIAEIPQLQHVEKLCYPRGPDGPVHPDLWEFWALHVRCSSCRHQTAEVRSCSSSSSDEVDRAPVHRHGAGVDPRH